MMNKKNNDANAYKILTHKWYLYLTEFFAGILLLYKSFFKMLLCNVAVFQKDLSDWYVFHA